MPWEAASQMRLRGDYRGWDWFPSRRTILGAGERGTGGKKQLREGEITLINQAYCPLLHLDAKSH